MKKDNLTLKDLGVEFIPETKTINFNGKDIIIKTYLPIEETLKLVSDTINFAADINKFYNPGKLDVAFAINVIRYYTNIELSDEELDNQPKLYDMLVTSGLYGEIKDTIEDELGYVKDLMYKTVDSIYKYQNSVMGILDAVNTDYDNLKLDATEITEKLSNKENLGLLKDVVTKLG